MRGGGDIDLQMLPTPPTKAVQLKTKKKTTTPAGTGRHDVNVDLGQL
jgi:hypothetical protein